MTKKCESILDQINSLFGDTSVPLKTTLKDLENIKDDIEIKIDAIECDIRNSED
jgi:hypothetical protein